MKEKGSGFINIVILIVIGLIALGFLGFNLREIIDSPSVRDNLTYAWDLTVKLWNTLLAAPAIWLWDKVQGIPLSAK